MSNQHASSNPINLRRSLPDTLPPEGMGGVQGTGASERRAASCLPLLCLQLLCDAIPFCNRFFSKLPLSHTAGSRFSCGGYGGAGGMGACAFGSLPPAIRRTVSGRIFLETGPAHGMPPGMAQAPGPVAPLLEPSGEQGRGMGRKWSAALQPA